jgi:rubrerythrin
MKARRRKAQRSTEDPASPFHDVLSQEGEIRSAYKRLQECRMERSRLEADRKEFDELSAGIEELQNIIAKLEAESRMHLAVLDARVSELRLMASDAVRLEKERRQALRDVNKIVKNREHFLEVRDRGIFVKFQLERLETKLNQLRLEIGMEKSRIDKMAKAGVWRCSECGAELSDDQSHQVRSDAESILDHKRRHVEQVEKEIADREMERTALREEYVKLDRQQQLLPAAAQRLAQLDVQWHQAKAASARLHAAEDEAARLKYKLDNHLIARSERQAVDEMKTKRQMLQWDADRARRLDDEIRELQAYEWKIALIDYLKTSEEATST